MLVTFLDNDRTHKTVATGFNKIGYVTKDDVVIYPKRRRIVETNLSKIKALPHRYPLLPDDLDKEKLEQFFTLNHRDFDLFFVGINSIVNREFQYFFNPIKLPILDRIDKDEHKKRWDSLAASIKKCDVLFTLDTKSLASRLISYVDNGPWSHTAMCSGEGTVIEAITSGVCERPVQIYQDLRYRVGLYRTIGEIPTPDHTIEFHRSQVGKRYSYKKAFIAGVQKYFRAPRLAPTPNDFAISPNIYLVAIV